MCKLCCSGAAVKALLKENQRALLCPSVPRQKELRGPAHLPFSAQTLWQFRKTVDFEFFGVTVTFAASQSVCGVIPGKQRGFPWAGDPVEQCPGSSLAALPSHQALVSWAHSPAGLLGLGHNQLQRWDCGSAHRGSCFMAHGSVRGFMTQVFSPYLS